MDQQRVSRITNDLHGISGDVAQARAERQVLGKPDERVALDGDAFQIAALGRSLSTPRVSLGSGFTGFIFDGCGTRYGRTSSFANFVPYRHDCYQNGRAIAATR